MAIIFLRQQKKDLSFGHSAGIYDTLQLHFSSIYTRYILLILSFHRGSFLVVINKS